MAVFEVFPLVFIILCLETSSSSAARVFKKEYLHPKTIDHEKLSGRWYEQMDTLNDSMRGNTVVDMVVLCNERLRSVLICHRWISSLEECRTTAFELQSATTDSPEGVLIQMSTRETLGNVTYTYFDPHPTDGFVVGFRQTNHAPDSYFVSSRQKDPRNLDKTIKEALLTLQLDIRDFNIKSKDFGCERKEENGIKL